MSCSRIELFLMRAWLARAAVLLAVLAAPLAWSARAATLPPDTAALVAKLDAKLVKKQALLADKLSLLADAQTALLAAQVALLDAQALPQGTPDEIKLAVQAIKLATKAVKKATAKVTKLDHKSSQISDEIDALMAKIEALDPGHFDDTSGGGGGGGGDPTGGDLDPADSLAVRAIDCGDLDGYPAPEDGWELLSENEAPAGVALSPAPLDTVHVAQFFPMQGVVAFPSSVATLDPDQVDQRRLLTSLKLANPTTLTVDGLSPDTDYRVLLELGATSPWTELVGGQWTALATDAPDIDVDAMDSGTWQSVARDVRCSTGLLASSWTTDLGGIVRTWVPVRSDDTGELKLRFSSSSGGPIYVASFAIFLDETLPIVYGHLPTGPLQSTFADATDFVIAFNADDLDAAQEAALALTDDWLRGVALCDLIGWLDGSRDGRVDLIPQAEAALAAARDAGHPGAVWLLSQLQSFDRALRHIAAGDSTHAKLCASEGGTGFLNPDCAGQIYTKIGQSDGNVNVHIAQRELDGIIAPAVGPTALHDLVQWNAGALGADRWVPSPLLPRALEQWAANIALMNPQLSVNASDPESQAMKDEFHAVFDAFTGLGFAATDFPDELELRLFKAYADAGTHPKSWDAADVALFDDAEIGASWWGADAAIPANVQGAPPWANSQRQCLSLYRNLCAYWLQDRLAFGEFGGGQGDDVELLLQLFTLFDMRRDGTDRRLAAGVDAAALWGLEQYPDVSTGYYDGALTDVEHTAEFTTDPFLAVRGAFGFTARAARLAFFNAHELLDSDDPASAFAGVNNAGRTRFKSYEFSASGPSDDANFAVDTFLNGRAMSPALALPGRGTLSSSHPAISDLRDWASGWRDDALSSAGKPEGFPAPALWPSGTLGAGGLWYSKEVTAGDTGGWTAGEASYVLGLLQSAYRGSTDVDRYTLLLPAVRMFRAAKAWEDAGEPNGAVGSAVWAAKTFEQAPRFGPLVAAMYSDLASDTTLNTQADPDAPASTYVDAALLTRMKQWATEGNNDLGYEFSYAAADLGACGAHALKSTVGQAGIFADTVTYYRNIWPLLTSRVLHTDRVFINPSSVLRELQCAWTGAIATEGLPQRPLVHWAGEGLDLAVLCNHVDLAGGAYSAFVYNFAPGAAAVTLQLDEGLPPGQYQLAAGAASANCDLLTGNPTVSLGVTKRGPGTSVNLSLATGLSLVTLTRTGSAAAAANFDFAVDPPLLVAQLDGSYEVHVRVVNVGGSAAPAASLDLYVAAVNPDGTLASPGALPSELLLSSTNVSLGAVSGWTLPETEKSFAIPLGSPLIDLLESGLGLQFRADIPAPGNEGDALNDRASRCWFLADVTAP